MQESGEDGEEAGRRHFGMEGGWKTARTVGGQSGNGKLSSDPALVPDPSPIPR